MEEARLGRIKVKYRNAEEYIRCRSLGILGKGCRAVVKKHGIAPVLLNYFNKGEYQEGLDSTALMMAHLMRSHQRGIFSSV